MTPRTNDTDKMREAERLVHDLWAESDHYARKCALYPGDIDRGPLDAAEAALVAHIRTMEAPGLSAEVQESWWLIEAVAPPRPLYFAGLRRATEAKRPHQAITTEDAGKAVRYPTEDTAKLAIAQMIGADTSNHLWPLLVANSAWKVAEHIFDYTARQAAASLARAAGVQEVRQDTFWLIERGPNQGQMPHMWLYLTPGGKYKYEWTETAIEATRYGTRKEAEDAIAALYATHCVATSHSLLASHRPEVAAPLPLEDSLSVAKVCCGEYANCHRPCTPRGRWQATQEAATPAPAVRMLTEARIDEIARTQDDEPWLTLRLTALEWRNFARDIEAAALAVNGLPVPKEPT